MSTARRCPACGDWLSPLFPICHGAEPIPWTRSLGIAENYLRRVVEGQGVPEALEGDALTRWVETYDENEWPGTSRGDMALALSCLRKWEPDFEKGYQEPVDPSGLFGRRAT